MFWTYIGDNKIRLLTQINGQYDLKLASPYNVVEKFMEEANELSILYEFQVAWAPGHWRWLTGQQREKGMAQHPNYQLFFRRDFHEKKILRHACSTDMLRRTWANGWMLMRWRQGTNSWGVCVCWGLRALQLWRLYSAHNLYFINKPLLILS